METERGHGTRGSMGPLSEGREALPTERGREDNVVRKQQEPELTEVPLDDPPEMLQPSEMG